MRKFKAIYGILQAYEAPYLSFFDIFIDITLDISPNSTSSVAEHLINQHEQRISHLHGPPILHISHEMISMRSSIHHFRPLILESIIDHSLQVLNLTVDDIIELREMMKQ